MWVSSRKVLGVLFGAGLWLTPLPAGASALDQPLAPTVEVSVAPTQIDFHYDMPKLGVGYDIRGDGIGFRLAHDGVCLGVDHGRSRFAREKPILAITLADLAVDSAILTVRHLGGLPLAIGVDLRTSVTYRYLHAEPDLYALPIPDLALIGAHIGPTATCRWEQPPYFRMTAAVGSGAGMLSNLEANRVDHTRELSATFSRVHVSTARPIRWGLSFGLGWTYLMERWTDERSRWSLQEYWKGLTQGGKFHRRHYSSSWELGVTW